MSPLVPMPSRAVANRTSVAVALQQTGLSLIEVLVAVLLVSAGLLGATGMHGRALGFMTDTERRQTAAMVASELMETLRADTATALDSDGMPKPDLGGYAKAAGTAMSTGGTAGCSPLPTAPATRLRCWGERAKQVIPDLDDTLISSNFAVGVDATGMVSVVVAWPVKNGECLDESDNAYCLYTLQSRL